MQRQTDDSGDYGYDLVHEEVGAPDPLEDPARHRRVGVEGTGGTVDSDGDLGYDEAHDL